MHNSVNQYFPNNQERSMGFSLTEYEKFLDMTSDSTLQLTLKKLLFVNFWFSTIGEEYPKLSKKVIKILFPLPTTYQCEACFPSCTSAKATYCNRLNTEPDNENPADFY